MDNLDFALHRVNCLDKTLNALNDAYAYAAGARLADMVLDNTDGTDSLEDDLAAVIESFQARRRDSVGAVVALGGTVPDDPWDCLGDYRDEVADG